MGECTVTARLEEALEELETRSGKKSPLEMTKDLQKVRVLLDELSEWALFQMDVCSSDQNSRDVAFSPSVRRKEDVETLLSKLRTRYSQAIMRVKEQRRVQDESDRLTLLGRTGSRLAKRNAVIHESDEQSYAEALDRVKANQTKPKHQALASALKITGSLQRSTA